MRYISDSGNVCIQQKQIKLANGDWLTIRINHVYGRGYSVKVALYDSLTEKTTGLLAPIKNIKPTRREAFEVVREFTNHLINQ